MTGKCLNPLRTIRSRASVALVSVLAHSGFLVMISATETSRAFRPIPTTRNARSLAVKIPEMRSLSSVTNTQSSLLAAISWAASAILMVGLIWRAWLGFSASTVPGGALRELLDFAGAFLFLLRSASILRRMALCRD